MDRKSSIQDTLFKRFIRLVSFALIFTAFSFVIYPFTGQFPNPVIDRPGPGKWEMLMGISLSGFFFTSLGKLIYEKITGKKW
jgi:hypothetical protein